MRAHIIGLVLTAALAIPAQAQHWNLTLVSRDDSMFTDLHRIERVAPHVYRAWSKYVYLKRPRLTTDAEALVQKEYDCRRGTRQVLSAVFFDADHSVTWKSNKPGPAMRVTRTKGQRQWSQVCNRVEGGLVYLIARLRVTMRRSTS